MPNTQEYRTLRKRINELRRHFLPATFSPTGDYSERQLDRARGFKLLTHAEIESYLESIAKTASIDAIRAYSDRSIKSTILISMLASYHSSWSSHDDKFNLALIERSKNRKSSDSINQLINAAGTQFQRVISDNNGIKRKSFISLFVSIGVELDDVDETLLSDLEEYGKQRGNIAHNSIQASRAIDPRGEFQLASSLVDLIKPVDEIVYNLLRELG